MRSYTFIINPIAGNGRAARLERIVQREAGRRGIQFEIRKTTHEGEAIGLSREASGDVVVAVGGDGTVNEVANGIGEVKTLGIIPAGSGNDLIKSLKIPKRPLDALTCLFEGHEAEIDIASVKCSKGDVSRGQDWSNERAFTNGVGVGFDASVAIQKGKIPYVKGTAVYLLAVFETLRKYKASAFSITVNGLPMAEQKLFLAAIGNGRCAGGGFYLTPNADPSDGLLDVTLIDDVPLFTILRLMPAVMRGRHLSHPTVHSLRTEHIVLESEEPFNVHADGEIVGQDVHSVEVHILPKKLRVITGI